MLGVVGTYEYARILDVHYPIRSWLVWPLGMLWGWVALFSLACTSFGQLLLVRALKLRRLPALESAVLSMAVGVVSFALAMYVAGAFGWFKPAFAVALPLVLLSAGFKHGLRLARDLIADVRRAAPHGPLTFAITAAGTLCVGLIYLGAMTPDAINYDATWCHLTVAQDYARAGSIIRFPGDYTKNMPQLASMIYTWGWLLPGLDQPLRWMMALHSEIGLFVWTLVGVAAGIRRLLDDQTLRGAWASFFLFPIIFVYDHNLGGAADHVCAFFCVPILLAALRVCGSFSRGSSILLGIVSAGAVLTKYQALYELAPLAVVIGVVWMRRMLEHRPGRVAASVPLRDLLLAPLLVIAVAGVCVSPHFIRQAVFHRNPFYPFLQDVFTHSTPTLKNAAFTFREIVTDPNWRPRGTLWQRLVHAFGLFFRFSFDAHYSFTRSVPVFGSLFTLLLPAVFIVRGRSRLLVALFTASGALLIWGMVYNVDRNLQIFMPLLVCVTAVLIVRLWRLGWLARAGLIPLVALQTVWGGDALFYSSYGRVESAIDLIRSGFEGRAGLRFSAYRRTFVAIGEALPASARLLIHTSHVSLGIDREILLDWIGFQSLISYDGLHTPGELFAYYRSLGITHLLYEPGMRPAGTKQEEVLWNVLVNRYAKSMGHFGGYELLRMPEQPPPNSSRYRVATVGLSGYADGLYPIDALSTNEYLPLALRKYPRPTVPMPVASQARDAVLSLADAVLVGPRYDALSTQTEALLRQRFAVVVPLPGMLRLYLERKSD
jgi:hypothetical protein